ncbi:organic cation transporter protein-like [Patiria miniata]|uniref:Major facilitator superfamily (MFS) profile domain-containing protein n=1 Tax=Patiria miniata TaxID=46514 RepID=A0A914BIH1_PATMI|nr:organic cation transporter protein-like [Patiria miniata]
MHYEDILNHIGPFGKYQKLLVFALFLVFIPPPFHFIGQVFLAANTDHWCAVPASQMINCSQLQLAECQEEQRSYSIPYEIDDDGNKVYSSCERYVMNDEDVGRNMSFNSTDVISCDAGWEFDHSRYKSTINEDFSLVCDRQDLPAYAQSVWFAGLLVGSLVWGYVGDWIGRRNTFILTVILVTISSTVTSFVPNFTAYAAMRFFTAASTYGEYLMIYVLVSEIVGPKNRVGATTVLFLAFAVGYMILSLLAFLLREWRHLQLAISLPFVLTFLVIIVFPESPRWLITKGRYKEATKIIEKIAKVNGIEAPEDLLDKLSEESKEDKKQSSRIPVTQLDLIRTPNLRKKTLILWVDWFVVNMVYYGLSLSTSALGVDDYLAAFVSGAIEIPSYLFCWYMMDRFGRRITLVAFYIFGGVFCLITIFIPLGAARAAVALLGKFAISAAFAQVFLAANTDHWCAVPASQMINCSQLQLAECQEEQKSYSIPYEIDDDGNKVYSSCEHSSRNGTKAPEDLLDKLSEESKEDKKQPSRIPVTQLDLIRTPNLRKKTLILGVDWFVVNMVFYGISLSTSALGVDDYLAAFVSGAIEIPSNLFCWYVMNRFGRRITLVAFYIFGGVFCLITIFIPLGAGRAAVAMFGKFAISAAFGHIYIYSLEIYPTIIRSIGMGTSSMVARVSGILCPIILILGKYWKPLPLCVFGGSAIIAGVLSLMLPETVGCSLPDTIQDGENFGSKSYNHLLSYHFCSSFAWSELAECQEEQKSYSIPYEIDDDGNKVYSSCERYVMNDEDVGRNISFNSTDVISCDAGWKFDHSSYKSTINEDFSLVCDRQDLPAFAHAAFGHIYIYTLEIYPTIIRSIGMGTSSMMARVSGILCPIILILGKYWEPLPLCVFGGNAIIAGVLSLMLPETMGYSLPDTIQDGENFSKGRSFQLCVKGNDDVENESPTQAPIDYLPLSTMDQTPKQPVDV